MATTQKAVLSKIKNSKIQLIDGNTDTINECMRRHLRKLAKVTTRKSKKNNAKVAAHPTKLAFVIFFDNGIIEQKQPKTRPVSPVVPPRSPVTPTSLPLVATPQPIVPTPSPILLPPSPALPPVLPSSPLPLPPSPLVLLPSPLALLPQLALVAAPIQDSLVPSNLRPTTTDAVLTLTQTIQQMDVSDESWMPDGGRICTITRKKDDPELGDLIQAKDEALEPHSDAINNLTVAVNLMDNKIKVVDDKIQQSDHQIQAAQHEKTEAKAAKAEYEEKAADLHRKINAAKVLWHQENEHWLGLINEHLRKRQINNRRRDVLTTKTTTKRLNTSGGR